MESYQVGGSNNKQLNKKLLDYIKQEMKNKLPSEEIRKNLIRANYNPQVIEYYISYAEISRKRKRKWLFAVIFFVAALIFLLYLITLQGKSGKNIEESALPDYAKIAEAAFLSEDYSSAIDNYLKVIGPGSSNPRYYARLGYAYSYLGDYKNSIYYYKKSLELDPNHANTLSDLGFVFSIAKDYGNALYYYNNSFSIDPDNGLTNYRFGVSMLSQSEIEIGKKFLLKAMEARPRLKGEAFYTSLAYLLQNDYNSALNISNEDFKISHDSPESYASLALAYLFKKDNNAAAFFFEKAINLTPGANSYKLSINIAGLGLAHLSAGNYDLSIKYFEDSLSKFELQSTHAGLAATYYFMNQTDKSKEMLSMIRIDEISEKNKPINLVFMGRVASVYKANKEYDKAIELYKMMMEISPRIDMPYQELAELYGLIGQGEKTNELLREYSDMKSAPNDNPLIALSVMYS